MYVGMYKEGNEVLESLIVVHLCVIQQDIPTIIGDSNDDAFLNALAKRTKVVVTTVGPYSKVIKAYSAPNDDSLLAASDSNLNNNLPSLVSLYIPFFGTVW